jgi:hypothetical protein
MRASARTPLAHRVGFPSRALAGAAAVLSAMALPGVAPAQDSARAPAPAAPPTAAPTADSAVVAALARGRRVLLVGADGRLAGDGARLLVDEARASRFVLVGEEHGVAEVPALTAALFGELVPAGFRHLAIETGAGVAAHLDTLVGRADAEGAVAAFVRDRYPGVPFYALREEARLLASAVRAARQAGARGPVLWGIDYDVMLDRWALGRLRALTPHPQARAAIDRVQARADSMLRAALAAGNPAALFTFATPESVVTALRAAHPRAPGSEADALLDAMTATLRINALMRAGRGYEANVERSRLLKRTLARHLADAAAPDGAPPRVLVKLGINHVLRGRNQTATYDVGSLLPELAEARGERALTVVLLAGRGARAAVFDPRTLGYAPQPTETAHAAWAQPLFAAADSAAWAVLDLRALRPALAAGRFGRVAPQLAQLVHGADLVVVLGGSTPATPLVPAVPAALAAGATGER